MKPLTQLRNVLLATLIATATQAQVAPPTAMAANKTELEKMGTPAIETGSTDAVTLDGLKLRNEKLFRSFTSQFANASDISIYPKKDATVIYCKVDGIRNNILYNAKGRVLHIVRYYDPALLPDWVSNLMDADFPDYKRTMVSEVNADGKTAYLVHLESAGKFKIVRCIDNDWDIYREFDKHR